MWYAYYDNATGRQTGLGSDGATAKDGQTRIEVGIDRPLGAWNDSTLTFDARATSRRLTKRKWLNRFTKPELRDVLGVDYSTIDKDIVAFHRFLMLIDDIDLDDQIITIGMTKVVKAGILTASRATAIMSDT